MSVPQYIFVAKNMNCVLLVRPAIQALDLVKIVQAVDAEKYKHVLTENFPKIFQGLGQIATGEYHIELKD